ncbi:hypothetical protein E4N62_16130 [Streptomyces sp. MNU76]|uniref:hypothetical protein n=1 Tax=Streptomyces sp. MNU76 TaxID=2560026 RepID=UPI001E42F052|nr:hypothetical protein [Streptomyces sp. MNU76]MCC9706664.1 hypothetical protein [Streptomyces sp. MNU76]
MNIPGLTAYTRTRRTARRDSRRQRREVREQRLGLLARESAPPAAPPSWRAGRGGRALAVLWCAQFLWFVVRPGVEERTGTTPGDWISLGWATMFATWMACRLGMWRVSAGHSGVWIRRFWTVRFLPWQQLSRVDMRRDGLLEFFDGHRQPMAGLYGPAWLNRILGRPDTGQETADVLTVMARHPRLRPVTDPDRRLRGTPFVVWSPLALGVVALAGLLP